MCWCATRHAGTHEEWLRRVSAKRLARWSIPEARERKRRYDRRVYHRSPERREQMRSRLLKKYSTPEGVAARRRIQRRWTAKQHREMGDYYIAQLLGLSLSQCPPALIAAKREQLQLVRFINDLEE